MKCLALLLTLVIAAAAASGEPTTQPAVPPRVAFVIDASVSMKSKFPDARDAVLGTVQALPADTQFAVLVDIADVTQRYPFAGLGPATAANKAAAERFLANNRLVPKGEGKLDVAVLTAIKMKPAAVWLYSDGDIAGNAEAIIKRLIATARESKVPIHTRLSLAGTRKREEVLFRIAKETGGTCLDEQGQAIAELPPIKDTTPKPGGNVFDQH